TTALDAGTLVVEREGVTRRITPRVIVGAWGRWGRIDTQLQRRFVGDRTHRSFGFKRHFFAARQPDAVELYSFSEGYLGVNAVEGGLTNICGLVHANRLAGHRGKWNAFVEAIRTERPEIDELFARHEPAQSSYLSSEPVIFRARSPVEQGVFMIGDAAGIIDPLTGNGMAMAMQSALIAASAVLQALEQPTRRLEIERSYAKTHRKLFAGRIRWSRAIASVLSSPEALAWLVGTVGTPRIGAFLVQRTRARREAIQRLADAFC
ncbi:MAG: FAD-dependent monooxygenase, partial [Thermoanaerobaculia bacterium]